MRNLFKITGTLVTLIALSACGNSKGQNGSSLNPSSVNSSTSGGSITTSSGGLGSSWVEAATAINTSTIGNPVAGAFQGHGADGSAMSGIKVNGTTYVDGMSGLWSSGFAFTSNTAGPIQGNSTEAFTTLSCPSGFRMTGVTGRSGAYIDSIAIVCQTEDQSQTYTSPAFGGPGGSAYTLSCPTGKFVTDLGGTSGAYLDALNLGCR
jgi:hypothetical protein